MKLFKNFKLKIKNLYKWCTKTRLRKILSLTLAILIFLTSIKFIFIPAPPALAADIYLGMNEGYGTTTSDTNSTATAFTITNAVWKTEDLCKVGKCLYFDGTGDYISHADDANLDMGAGGTVTIEGWFRTPDITSGTRTLVAKEESTGADGGYKIEMDSSGFIVFGIDNDNSGFPSDSITTSTAYDDNAWHHFAAVKNGSTSITLYVDAVLIGTDSSIQNDVSNDDTFYVGIYNGSTNGYSGFIDEVKVMRSARTQAEINADYTGETPSRGTTALFGPDQSYLSKGLVGYWKMEEAGDTTRADSSGNGNTLTESASDTVAQATGKFGYAGDFELGDTEDLSIADNATLSITGSLTLAAWIKPETVSAGTYNILAKWDGDTNESYRLMQNADEIRIEVNDAGNYVETTASNLATATWYHVVGVYNSATATGKVYINGVEATSTTTGTIPSAITDTASAFQMGAEDLNNTPKNYYDGVIDEARIYNRPISSLEVAKLYAFAPGPVGYWKMDENTGSSANDSSGNGSAMTLTSTAWAGGKFGSAISLSGTSSYGQVSDNSTLSLTRDLTLSAYIKPTVVTAATRFGILTKGNDYALIQYGDEIRMYVGSTSNYATTDAANLAVGTWYHVSAVYNSIAQTVSLYVNGVLQASTVSGTIPSSISDGSSATNIGLYTESSTGTIGPQSVAISSDDANVSFGGNCSDTAADINDTELLFGKVGTATETCSGARFTNITIPNAATITSATFEATCKGTYTASGTLQVIVAAEAVDDAATFTTSGLNLSTSARPRTSYTSGWNLASCTADVAKTKDVTTPVQEVINRAGWASGNDLVILVDNDGSSNDEWQDMWSLDGTGQEPRITINYSGTSSYYFSGIIDDAKIYDYTRTPSQITEDMNGGHPAPGSPVGSAVGYWKFDEGYGDTANNGGSGTTDFDLAGSCPGAGTCPTWTNSGKFGKALSFDGGDYASIATASDNDFDFNGSEKFSISAWFYSTSMPAVNEFDSIVNKWDDTSNQGGYGIALTNDDSDSTGEISIAINDESAGQLIGAESANDSISTNTWYHVVMTFNGGVAGAAGDLKLYVNGILTDESAANPSFLGLENVTSDLTIGDWDPNDASAYFTTFIGRIDEVKIYASELNADQVKVEYNHGSGEQLGATSTDSSGNATWSSNEEYCPPGQGSSCTPPVFKFDFDENTGTTTNDTSTNGYVSNAFSSGVVWTGGKYGSGLSFDSLSSSVSVTDSGSNLDITSSFTLSVWAKPYVLPGTGNYDTIIFKGISGTTEGNYYIELNDADDVNCGFYDAGAGGYNDHDATNATVAVGNWYQITCVFDNTNDLFKIYVNGVEVYSATETAASPDAHNGQLTIGQEGTNIQEFGGIIDGVKLYNYARTPEQVAWDYNRGGPAGWWKFDENSGSPTTLNDSSGNGFSGSANGSMDSADWVSGKFNTALDFDGSDDYVSVAYNSSLDFTENISVSFWFKPASTIDSGIAVNTGLVSKANTNTDANNDWVFFWNTADAGRMRFGTYGDSVQTNTATWTAGTWYFVTAVVTSTNTANVYVNGVLNTYNSDSDISTSPINGNQDTILNIGLSRISSGDRYFNGVIDDVRIYNYPLTTQQVKSVMNEGAAVKFTQ